jgi:hypothetical protein
MRLTVVVEALAEENAHGDYRDAALAAFKERKFAMPVQLDMTFEAVWADIEQRYKTNYLDPQQAATFSIKKLQDAYDCDLDMTDTVGDIFAGETDVKMRVIKVIPHFIYRDTSVVPGSMLRPKAAQKRGGEDVEDGTNKRRRVASQQRQRQGTYEARECSPNRPISSTESQRAVPTGPEDTQCARRSTRSKTGASLVELSRTETGQAPFSTTAVKQEDPQPEQLPHLNGTDAASPNELTRSHKERPSHDRTRTPREDSQEAPVQPMGEEGTGLEETGLNETGLEGTTEDRLAATSRHEQAAQLDPREVALQQSPISSIEPEFEPAPATRQRKDIYDVPNSPDFMHKTITPDKPGRTYGRSPKTGPNLLNGARECDRFAENETPAPPPDARATHRLLANVPPSTPQETAILATQTNSNSTGNEADDDDADLTTSFLEETAASSNPRTPARRSAVKPAKPGSLKKPSRSSLLGTPVSAKRDSVAKAAATPAMATHPTQSRPALWPSPGQSKPLKNPLQPPSSSKKRSSVSSAASQSVPGSSKGKQAAIFKTPARKTAAPQSAQTPTGILQEKPFECLTCQARFSREDNLRRHMKSHTEGRTHPCSNCGRKFTRPDILLRHQRREECRQSSFDSESVGKDGTDRDRVRTDSRSASVRSRGEKITPYLHVDNDINTRRNDVPLSSNESHLRGGKSSGSSLFENGDPSPIKNGPSATVKTSAKTKSATPKSASKSREILAEQPNVTTLDLKPSNGTIEVSSAESSSESEEDEENELDERSKVEVDGAHDAQAAAVEERSQRVFRNRNGINDQDVEPAERRFRHEEAAAHLDEPPTQDKPPSGQEELGAARWSTQSWGFSRLHQTENTNHESSQHQARAPAAAVVTPVTEDEGFSEQDTYITALEDNRKVGSRSASAAASPGSSPAVSRRPARFLSHSPTPDASESEDETVEATAAKVPSPHVNNRDESDSDSSSDSSEGDNVELPDLPAGRTAAADVQADLPSSPPLAKAPTLSPRVLPSNQSIPSQHRRPVQQTPVVPPTLQSSQAPRSSQSVSVQAVDRRRYTGFRTLREQLADTRAAQPTTQKKPFDPRTMSLGKLVKNTPLTGLGGDDESSDDESSSSSSSDSD